LDALNLLHDATSGYPGLQFEQPAEGRGDNAKKRIHSGVNPQNWTVWEG
jgi:hypothetical protein